MLGGNGQDRLNGGAGNDELHGGNGNDRLRGEDGDDKLFGEAGNDYMHGGNGKDFLHGGAGNDDLRGGAGDDILKGGVGNDSLMGGSGNDQMVGGYGADVMKGGSGADTFWYFDSKQSANAPGQSDTIQDFKHGVDKIDLSHVDANTGIAGNQKFEVVQYDPSKPLEAGQVTSHYDFASGKTIVEAAVDNNAGADMKIALDGFVPVTAQDFNL